MAAILIDYARFVELQQRRARIADELGRRREAPASPTLPAPVDEAVEGSEPTAAVVDAKKTCACRIPVIQELRVAQIVEAMPRT